MYTSSSRSSLDTPLVSSPSARTGFPGASGKPEDDRLRTQGQRNAHLAISIVGGIVVGGFLGGVSSWAFAEVFIAGVSGRIAQSTAVNVVAGAGAAAGASVMGYFLGKDAANQNELAVQELAKEQEPV